MTTLTLFSPAGVLVNAKAVRLAAKRLRALGFDVETDAAALVKQLRFAGDDEARLDAIHRVAGQAPGVALATRGGYGLTRLLDRMCRVVHMQCPSSDERRRWCRRALLNNTAGFVQPRLLGPRGAEPPLEHVHGEGEQRRHDGQRGHGGERQTAEHHRAQAAVELGDGARDDHER